MQAGWTLRQGGTVLFECIGTEWAQEIADQGRDLDPSLEEAVQAVLTAHPSDFGATASKFSAELRQAEPALLARAEEAIRSDHGVEMLGRALVSIGHYSEPGKAAGHFLIGYAHRLVGDEGPRHFELAQLSYRNVQLPRMEALTGLAVEAAASLRKVNFQPTTNLENAFTVLSEVEPELAQRIAPAMRQHTAVLLATQGLAQGDEVSQEFPLPLSKDDLMVLRFAEVKTSHNPDRVLRAARWIQSARGLSSKSTEELDTIVRLLSKVREWDACIHVLRDLMDHGDQRPETLIELANSLYQTGKWSEGKSLLIAFIDDKPGPKNIPILQEIVRLSWLARDADLESWLIILRSLGADLPPIMKKAGFSISEEAGKPPRVVMRTARAKPRGKPNSERIDEAPTLLASFRDGKLTIDPSAVKLGQHDLEVHIATAVILGNTPDKGSEFLNEIHTKKPEIYQDVVNLLPPQLRPPSEAEQTIMRADALFKEGRHSEAFAEFQKGPIAGPDEDLAHFWAAVSHFSLGQYQIAIAHASESIAIQPSPAAYHILGESFLRGNHDLRKAQKCLKDALALDPSDEGIQVALDDLMKLRPGGDYHE